MASHPQHTECWLPMQHTYILVYCHVYDVFVTVCNTSYHGNVHGPSAETVDRATGAMRFFASIFASSCTSCTSCRARASGMCELLSTAKYERPRLGQPLQGCRVDRLFLKAKLNKRDGKVLQGPIQLAPGC